jgi:Uma2 family endonuclease
MKTLAKWSIDQYHRMVDAGILQGRRVELLAGEIVEMSPETPIHYSTAKQGTKYLEELLAGKAEVRFNGPITLTDSEPEPDIAIVRLPASTYKQRHPIPADIFWVIEVAKTSLKIDLELKASIYATAGIQEYWIIDLTALQVIVSRTPEAGEYLEKQTFTEGMITPLAFPEVSVSAQQLFA